MGDISSGVGGGGGGGGSGGGTGGGSGAGIGGSVKGTIPTADYFSQSTIRGWNATPAPPIEFPPRAGGSGGGGAGIGGGGGGVKIDLNQPNNCYYDILACEKDRRCRGILR